MAYVCLCVGVSDSDVDEVIAAGAATTGAVGDACGAGTGCGSCVGRIENMISAACAALDASPVGRFPHPISPDVPRLPKIA